MSDDNEFGYWLVTLNTPKGEAQLEIPTHHSADSDIADRRAIVVAASQGWGDLDEIKVTASEWHPQVPRVTQPNPTQPKGTPT